jgi:hypothetical protein
VPKDKTKTQDNKKQDGKKKEKKQKNKLDSVEEGIKVGGFLNLAGSFRSPSPSL